MVVVVVVVVMMMMVMHSGVYTVFLSVRKCTEFELAGCQRILQS